MVGTMNKDKYNLSGKSNLWNYKSISVREIFEVFDALHYISHSVPVDGTIEVRCWKQT